MERSTLQIGELATRSGVSVDTVRYYERRQLIAWATRSNGGYRIFPIGTIERIKFIKQAQELGFSLDDIKQLLANGSGEAECRRVRDILRQKLSELDQRIKLMHEFRRTVANNLANCERELNEHGQDAHCPVVITIERSGTSKVGEKETSHEAQN
ncbi:MAG TPA: heavy metal-responsive transcriptional regulator [Pyrinomonadaceae bacterium]|nr:heavy metal-responsive transcriptional regulator [Pyrinomonadaceae bacterium]